MASKRVCLGYCCTFRHGIQTPVKKWGVGRRVRFQLGYVTGWNQASGRRAEIEGHDLALDGRIEVDGPSAKAAIYNLNRLSRRTPELEEA